MSLACGLRQAGGDDVLDVVQHSQHAAQVALEFGVPPVGKLNLGGSHAQVGQVIGESTSSWVGDPTLGGQVVAGGLSQDFSQTKCWSVDTASGGEDRAGVAVVGYHYVRLTQEIAQGAGLWLGERIGSARATVLAVGGEGIRLPVVARTAVQVGVGVTVQVHAVGVKAAVLGQAVWVGGGNEPQGHGGRHVLGVGLEMGLELQQQFVGVGLVTAVDVADQRHLVGARAKAIGGDGSLFHGVADDLRGG